jgi:two-component system OmpR family sensor kinase
MPHKPIGGQRPAGEQAAEVLAVVAHELRRPLTALLGAIATLQQRGQTLSVLQQQELLGMAGRQGEQLQRLLEQLLAAALDRGETRAARRSPVDATVLAIEAGQAARLAHLHHRIAIEVAGPLLVRVDPLAVARILGNLLDNAAIHTPRGSPIRLSVVRDGPQAVLAVQDHGPGIPPDQRDRIFERYTQLGQRPGHGSGLGLGLYIARRLARANRGDLHLCDPPDGQGACFELRLPLAPPAPQRPPQGAAGIGDQQP